MNARMNLFAELKRRNVLRAAALYAGAVWALAQGISQLAPVVNAPDWASRAFLIAAAIGFPFWIAFAWLYEFTAQGLKRESDIAADTTVTRSRGRKLDLAIIAVLAIAVVLLLTNQFVWRKGVLPENETVAVPDKSVAVLPFQNLSGDPQNGYFSDGVTEEIINALAQIPELKVAGRNSAFRFRGGDNDAAKVGAALGVATVLEGSVQKAGDEVRITTQLVNARDGYQLWSEKYDRKLTSIFAVEDEISKAIADKLRVQLGDTSRPLVKRRTTDPRAHDFYLRGTTLVAARGPGLRDAAEAFQQAVAIDPGYAQAWAGLAQAEALVANWHLDDKATAQARALAAAQRALELDANVAAAHMARGIVYDDQWRWAEAGRELRRALALAPGDAEVIDQHAQFLLATGQLEPALREIEHANRLDPLSGIIGSVHAEILLDLHRCDEASAQIAKALAVAPDMLHTNGAALNIAVVCRRHAQAEVAAQRLASVANRDPKVLLALVRGVADPAARAQAVRLAETVPPQSLNWGSEKAWWLALLGDKAAALAALESQFGNGPAGGAERLWLPAFDPIRNDPRFKAVLKKIGLPYIPKDLDQS